MQLQINFHHLDATDAIKSKIDEKASRLNKYMNGNFNVTWTCTVDRKGQTSHIHLSGSHMNINAQATSDDLYKTFDDVIHKVEKQLKKHKSIAKDHIHHKHEANIAFE